MNMAYDIMSFFRENDAYQIDFDKVKTFEDIKSVMFMFFNETPVAFTEDVMNKYKIQHLSKPVENN